MAAGNFALPILEKPSLKTNNNDITAYFALITAHHTKKRQKQLEKQLFFLFIRALDTGL